MDEPERFVHEIASRVRKIDEVDLKEYRKDKTAKDLPYADVPREERYLLREELHTVHGIFNQIRTEPHYEKENNDQKAQRMREVIRTRHNQLDNADLHEYRSPYVGDKVNLDSVPFGKLSQAQRNLVRAELNSVNVSLRKIQTEYRLEQREIAEKLEQRRELTAEPKQQPTQSQSQQQTPKQSR